MSSYVRIFDTTLRDGEQSPGASMTSAEKLEVARGDLFVDGVRLQKDPAGLEELWFPVHDTDFSPREGDPLWKPDSAAPHWTRTGSGWQFSESGPTEEAILNSLFKATTITGKEKRTVQALPVERVKELLRKFGKIQ